MNLGNWLGTSSVPVLCYHNLGGNGVPRAAFEAQMRWLADNGVQTLSQEGLRAFLDGRALAAPSVMLTFDDGFRDLFTYTGDVLRGHGFTATVFIINDRMREDGTPGQDGEIIAHEAHERFLESGNRSAWLSWHELEALVEERTFEVGSHSATHRMEPAEKPELLELPGHWAYVPDRGSEAPYSRRRPELAGPLWLGREERPETDEEFKARAQQNLTASRQELEERLKRPCTALGWPWGENHPLAEKAADEAGLDLRFTLRRGAVRRGTPAGAVPRLEVRRKKGLSWFASRIAIYSRAWTAALYSGTRI